MVERMSKIMNVAGAHAQQKEVRALRKLKKSREMTNGLASQ